MKRRKRSGLHRAMLFMRAGGKCEQCGAKITNGKFELDHRLPMWMGEDDSDENIQCLCHACHKRKTAKEAGGRAKCKRWDKRLSMTEKEYRAGRRKIAGRGFDKRFRRKLDGTVERLNT